MVNNYNRFSKYYRQLIYNTKHIEQEIETINYIISDLQIKKHHFILDAACGSGDLLFYLNKNGYYNISGLDGSIGMLNKAKEILPNISCIHMCWEDIKVQELNKSDFIFILSISLLHASFEQFYLIFKNIYRILNSFGVFVIDNRFWSIINGEIIQENRPVDRYSNETRINIGNEHFIIDDTCYYSDDKQYIKYRIRTSKNVEYYEFSYSKILSNTIVEILYEAGFSNVEKKKIASWPYELLYAYKKEELL